MKQRTKEQGLAHIGIILAIVVTITILVGFYVVNRESSEDAYTNKTDVSTTSNSNLQTKSTITEEWEPTEETASQPSDTEGQEDDLVLTPKEKASTPTMFPDGPSTKLDRADIHGATLMTGQLYAEYLYALQSTDKDKRQEASQAFFQENKTYFSSSFYDENATSTDSLPLLGLNLDAKLPTSVRNGSAIFTLRIRQKLWSRSY